MPDEPQPFRIAFVPGVTVSKWTRVWAERRPHDPLILLPLEEAAQETVLREGTADMAFVRLPVHGDALNAIPLYEETVFVVVPRDHPVALFDSVTLADLAGEQVLTDGAEDAIALVAAGVGIALLPQSIARLHGRKDVVGRPVTDAPPTSIALAWTSDETDAADDRIEEFIGIVRGRTARSSRGATAETPPARPRKPKKAGDSRKRTQRKDPGRSPRKPGTQRRRGR